MEAQTLSLVYRDLIKKVIASSHIATRVNSDNVFQEGERETRAIFDAMIADLLLPGSRIDGRQHLADLFERAQNGAACLLLLEHYSNMDLPGISYLLRHSDAAGMRIADALVAIAGRKLNEENPAVAAFAGAYTRIVLCPSRYMNASYDNDERLKIININRAAMKKVDELKRAGKIILVFPAGTRCRPWDPESKRGVREMDSYIKSFDYFCPVAINGLVLDTRGGDMLEDCVSKDVLVYTAGEMRSCADFRAGAKQKALAAGAADMKQAVVDELMKMLDVMHEAAELSRCPGAAPAVAG